MKVKQLEQEWKRKVGKQPIADPLDRLEELEKFFDQRPPGGFTVVEAAKKRGVNRSSMRERLIKLEKLGKLKRHQQPGSSRIYYTIL